MIKIAKSKQSFWSYMTTFIYPSDECAYLRLAQLAGNRSPRGLVNVHDLIQFTKDFKIGGRPVVLKLRFHKEVLTIGTHAIGYEPLFLSVSGWGPVLHLSSKNRPGTADFDLAFTAGARGGKKKVQQKPNREDQRAQKFDAFQELAVAYPQSAQNRSSFPCLAAFNGKPCSCRPPRSSVCQIQRQHPRAVLSSVVEKADELIQFAIEGAAAKAESEKQEQKEKEEMKEQRAVEKQREDRQYKEYERMVKAHALDQFQLMFVLQPQSRDPRIVSRMPMVHQHLLRYSGMSPSQLSAKMQHWLERAKATVISDHAKARMYCAKRLILSTGMGTKCCNSHSDLCGVPDLTVHASQRSSPVNEMDLRRRTTEMVDSTMRNAMVNVTYDNPNSSFWFLIAIVFLFICFIASYFLADFTVVAVPALALLSLLPSVKRRTVLQTTTDPVFQNNVASQQLDYDARVNLLRPTEAQSVNERKDVEMLYKCTLAGIEIHQVDHVPDDPNLRLLLPLPLMLAIWMTLGFSYMVLGPLITFVLYRKKKGLREVVSLEMLAAFNSGSCKTVSETMVDYIVSCRAIIRNYVNLIDTAHDSLGRRMASNLADGTLRVAKFLFHRQQLENLQAETYLNGIGGGQGHSLVWQGMGFLTYLQQSLASLTTLVSFCAVAVALTMTALLHQAAPNMTQILFHKLLFLLSLTMLLTPVLISLTRARPLLARFIGFWETHQPLSSSMRGRFAGLFTTGCDAISNAMLSAGTFCGSTTGSQEQTTPTSRNYSLLASSSLVHREDISEQEEYSQKLARQTVSFQPFEPLNHGEIQPDLSIKRNMREFQPDVLVSRSFEKNCQLMHSDQQSVQYPEYGAVSIAGSSDSNSLIGYLTDPDSEELESHETMPFIRL